METSVKKGVIVLLIVLHIIFYYVLNNYYVGVAYGLTTGYTSVDYYGMLYYTVLLSLIPFIATILTLYTTRSIVLTIAYTLLMLNSLKHLWSIYGGSELFGLPILILPAMATPLLMYIAYTVFMQKKFVDELPSYISTLKNRRPHVIESISSTAVLFSVTGLILYIASDLGLVEKLLPVGVSDYITGVLVNLSIAIPLLIITTSESLDYVIITAILTPFSWITTPLYTAVLSLVTASREYLVKGVFIGVSKAILEYGVPSRLYREVNQEPLIGSSRGKTWYWRSYSEPVSIDPYSNPNPHIAVFGASGTGKSSLAKSIVYQLYRKYGVNFLIIDHHNEYLDLLEYLGSEVNVLDAEKASINPLDLEGRSPRQRAIELADIIQSIFNLGYIQRNTLEEIILETYRRRGILEENESTWSLQPPTFYDVLRTLDELIETSPSEQYKAMLERIRPYIRMLLSNVFLETRLSLSELLEKPSIILLATLPSDQARALYLDTLLYKIVNTMYSMGHKKTVIVVDEAHHLFRRTRSKTLISRLLMESRKYGLGLIVIVQQPLDVNESVILNSYTRIVFSIREHRNLEYISRSISGYMVQSSVNAVKIAIANLPRHHIILNIGDKLYIVDTKPALLGWSSKEKP